MAARIPAESEPVFGSVGVSGGFGGTGVVVPLTTTVTSSVVQDSPSSGLSESVQHTWPVLWMASPSSASSVVVTSSTTGGAVAARPSRPFRWHSSVPP